MYWTTPTSPLPPNLRSAPLSTSPAEYLRAIRALTFLITPLSAQLLPLLTVYTNLRVAQAPSLAYFFSLDEQIAHAELQELYARIVLLWQEMRGHYVDFCYLYGERGVGDVWEMLWEMEGMDRVRYADVVTEWGDLRWLAGDQGWEVGGYEVVDRE